MNLAQGYETQAVTATGRLVGGSVLGGQLAPRDKTQAEVIADRLRATIARMAEYNTKMSESLDRLNGGTVEEGKTIAATPMPSDFVGAAIALLDEIGRELGRMENNGMRLARLA